MSLLSELKLSSAPATELKYDSDSGSGTHSEYDSDTESEYVITAQQQWDESIGQLNELVSHVLFPLAGKLLGRRTAHSLWHRIADWIFGPNGTYPTFLSNWFSG